MSRLFGFFLGIAMLFAVSTHAEIKSIQRFDEVVPFVDKNTLVLINISDTIYTSKTTMGRKKWRVFLKERVLNLIQNHPSDFANQLEGRIVQMSPKTLLDKNIPNDIKEMQTTEAIVLGVTMKNRSPTYFNHFDERVTDHLHGFGINFSDSSIHFNEGKNQPSIYKGVLFTEKTSYASALEKLYAKVPTLPRHIILIEDNLSELKDVEGFANDAHIQYTGFHYVIAHNQADAYDPVIGIIEFLALVKDGTLLTDDEAQTQRNKSDTEYYQLFDNWLIKNGS